MAKRTLVDPDSPTIDGIEVWKSPRLGGQKRAAAYLWFNKDEGDTFTMSEIRAAIGTNGTPDTTEHLNRRVRELRKHGWAFPSSQDDRELDTDDYQLTAKGMRVWAGERNTAASVSNRLRRIVFERDGNRCVLCGVESNGPYPGEPDSKAQMTVGHLHPQAREGKATKENLRTECSRCNEPVRDELRNADTLEELLAALPRRRADRQQLKAWIELGYMTRSPLIELWDRIRVMPQETRDAVAASLR